MQHTMHLHGWAQPAAGLASRHGRVRRAVAARAAAMTTNSVLWVDGSPAAEAPASPQPVLADRPSGAYTTAYVADGTHIVDWPRHLERLYWNMRRLHDSRPPAFAGCLAWLQQEGSQPEARLQQLLAPQIHQALTHLHNQQCGPQPALLVVSLEDVATRHSSSSSSSSSGGGGDGETSAGVSSPAAAPMSHPVQEAAAGSSSSSNTVSHGLSCAVYCKVVPPVPLSPSPVEVLAAGDPRPLPHVKYNQWVIDRRPLEALKAAAGVEEVILVGPGQRLVEGLASNFYVIEHTAAGPVLHTNSPQEAALPGVTQRRVLEAALQLGLTVQLSAPALREADTWQEAFLTNCLRGIQPVSCIKWTTSDQPGPAGEDYVVLPSPPGPITQQLQQLVQQLQEATPVADWQ